MDQEKKEVLRAEGIYKSFGSTKAVVDFSITVNSGEIRGLIGENGSGKSTFAAVTAGVYKKDGGHIFIMGKEYCPNSSIEAAKQGVAIIMQEIATIETISVAANIYLNQEEKFGKYGFRSNKKMNEAAAAIFSDLGFSINPEALTGSLNLEERKLVELAKAMAINPKLLIVDETSNALTKAGRIYLYKCINKIIENGGSVIFITHDMEELLEICNSVTIMRDGHLVDTLYGSDMDTSKIKKLMVGREIADKYYRSDFTPKYESDVVLSVKKVCSPTADNISFELHKGEILGIGGLSDCGMHELGKVLFGLEKPDSGTVETVFDGKNIMIDTPVTAIDHGVAYLSKNRDTEAIIMKYSIMDNICIPILDKLKTHGFILRKNEKVHATKWARFLEIKMKSNDQFCSELSGGNKQKVVLAKWLGNDSKVFVMDCPTRGIDIGVKEKIYRMMEDMKKEGRSMIMISEELPELIGMSDRIMIMKNHRVSAFIDRSEFVSESQIIEVMI